MAAQRLGKRVLSKLQSPSRARGPGGSPGGLQKRHARVTVKYDRRELQRRLDVEKWIDGRLEELYRGMVSPGRAREWSGTDGARARRSHALGVSVLTRWCTVSLVCTRGRVPQGWALTGLALSVPYGIVLVDTPRATYKHLSLQRCVQMPGEGQEFSI